MSVSLFTRFVNLRGITKINNIGGVLPALSATEHLTVLRPCRATLSDVTNLFDEEPEKSEKMSKAMKAYLQRSREYDEFRQKEIAEFEIGKRHLANMMGEDVETFDREKISKSIKYLFPSGLFDFRARPKMQHPDMIYPVRKAAEFDETGRPHHTFFYTCKPNYYEILYNLVEAIEELNTIELNDRVAGNNETVEEKIDIKGRTWISKNNLEKRTLETLTDLDYESFVSTLVKVVNHPYSAHVSDLIETYQNPIQTETKEIKLRPLLHDANGRPFIVVPNCMRKSSRGKVIIWANGSGKITINGQDITYFKDMQCREQIIFPLIFTNMMNKVDIEAYVKNGGPTGQSGAIRWGIAWGLRNFVDNDMMNKMKIAGLLTRDWRSRERKKFGQEGARRKFTWKKR